MHDAPSMTPSLSLRYRLFDFDDMRDELVFPGHVVNDRTLVTEPRLAGRWEYTKHNADLDARWRFGPPDSQPELLSHATGEINTRNPIRPTSGTPAQQANATAKPFPDFKDSLFQVETALRYRFWKNWTTGLGYIFEKFDKDDFRTDTLNPFVPGITSIWLGNDLKDYTAHILVLTLGYRF